MDMRHLRASLVRMVVEEEVAEALQVLEVLVGGCMMGMGMDRARVSSIRLMRRRSNRGSNRGSRDMGMEDIRGMEGIVSCRRRGGMGI